MKNLPSPTTVKWIAFADCGDDDSPPAEFQHQVLLVSSGSALRFSLFWRTPECFCNTSPRAFRLRYDDSDLAFVGRTNKTSLFGWSSLGLFVGVIAEVTFVRPEITGPKKGYVGRLGPVRSSLSNRLFSQNCLLADTIGNFRRVTLVDADER